ncbi:MAG: site-specific DNA-methyltransferase [Oscillatoriaceae cyanobacterium Prado104]|jgi:site-specific DNA-methyltransferase (adenine-specific)|nr:site-specific DNA-methyltransferase [Oscillatoriaceae cyanobacterium Prado104]
MKTDLLRDIQIQNDRKIKIDFQHPRGTLFCGDSLQWLKTLASESIDLIFADPPYNLKKAEWDIFESPEVYIDWSLEWIRETARILKPTGSIYIMGFSEILADLKYPAAKYFRECRWLVWHYKNKANLGKDWGRSHESILHFRKQKNTKINIDNIRIPYGEHTLKYPARSQAITSQYNSGKQIDDWTPNPKGGKPKDVIEVPTTCNGMNEKTKHPTQKPEELVRKLILASSNRGDTVVDPFSGAGTALVAAEQLGRRWLGCEINPQYNQWAVQRLQQVKQMTDEEWFWFDRHRQKRRQQIR